MDTLNKYLRIFGFIFVAFFLVLGILLIFTDYFSYIPQNIRIVFAGILILYGAFRLLTLVNKYKQSEGDEE